MEKVRALNVIKKANFANRRPPFLSLLSFKLQESPTCIFEIGFTSLLGEPFERGARVLFCESAIHLPFIGQRITYFDFALSKANEKDFLNVSRGLTPSAFKSSNYKAICKQLRILFRETGIEFERDKWKIS